MRVCLWKDFGALNSKPVFAAFEKSIKNAGDTVVYNNIDSDINVIWSVLWNGRMAGNKKIWDYCRSAKKPVIVLEVGGLVRNKTWRIGLNGVNRDATWIKPYDNHRAALLGLQLKEWNTTAEGILLCGQHSKSEQWRGMPPIQTWMENTIKQLREHTNRPIYLRPHPRCYVPDISKKYNNVYYQKPNKIKKTYDDYDFSLKNIGAVFSHNSNPGIHAAICGVPVWTGSSSLAYPVSNKTVQDINNPQTPRRDEWLIQLAHCEYLLEEIEAGVPYEHLTRLL